MCVIALMFELTSVPSPVREGSSGSTRACKSLLIAPSIMATSKHSITLNCDRSFFIHCSPTDPTHTTLPRVCVCVCVCIAPTHTLCVYLAA